MARIRSVKPETWSDRRLARDLNREQRLFYIGLWNEADDEGRLVADPRKLMGAIYPYERDLEDEFAIDVLRRLAETGRAVLYEMNGEHLCQLTKFREHQRINRPTPSKYPPPPRGLKSTLGWLETGKDFPPDCGKVPEIHGALSEDSLSKDTPGTARDRHSSSVSPHGGLSEPSVTEVEVEVEVEQGELPPSPTPPANDEPREGGDSNPGAKATHPQDRAALIRDAEPIARLGLNRMRGRDDEGDVEITPDGSDRTFTIGYGLDLKRWRELARDLKSVEPEVIARALYHAPSVLDMQPPITMALVEDTPGALAQMIHRALGETPVRAELPDADAKDIPAPSRNGSKAEQENRERLKAQVRALRAGEAAR